MLVTGPAGGVTTCETPSHHAETLYCSVANIVFSGVSGTGNTRSAFGLEMIVLVVYTLFIYVSGIWLQQPVHICFIAEIVYFSGLLIVSVAYLRWLAWNSV